MHEHTTISRLTCKTVINLQSVIGENLVSYQMAAWCTKANQFSISDNEWTFHRIIIIHLRHIDVPSTQILPVKQVYWFWFFLAGKK